MLYLDERVELPKTKTYANGPYIYYRLGSYMQNGKERHHQRCIGKCFTDAQNKRWLIPMNSTMSSSICLCLLPVLLNAADRPEQRLKRVQINRTVHVWA